MTVAKRISDLSANLAKRLAAIENDDRQYLLDHYQQDRTAASAHIKKEPDLSWITCVHVIGEARAMKSSFILDLFDNPDLRTHLNIIDDSAHDHTACPCMVIPTEEMQQSISIERVNIFNLEEKSEVRGIHKFQELYALPRDKEKLTETAGGYFLKIFLPREKCKFPHVVIEYPGIDSKKYQSAEKEVLYNRLQEEFKALIEKIPGFVVACFEKKIDVPDKHPLDTFVKSYKNSFGKGAQRLPLIFSFNGSGAIRTYCSGNSDLINLIDSNFSIHDEFDTRVQLINPNYQKYPIIWPDIANSNREIINTWISKFSNYKNYENLSSHIEKDGGFEYSRELLSKLVEDEELSDSIGLIFHNKWLEEGEEILSGLVRIRKDMDEWDDVKRIIEHIRKRLSNYVNNPYLSVKETYHNNNRDFSSNTLDSFQEKNSHRNLWLKTIADYYLQFVSEDICLDTEAAQKKLTKIANEILDDVLTYYSGSNKPPTSLSFFSDEDMNNALLTIMTFYLPNQILKENKRLLTAMLGR
ncbi:hypothetical protein KKC91_01385 [bacterium]|nr:hypothetical protein [bacterium]